MQSPKLGVIGKISEPPLGTLPSPRQRARVQGGMDLRQERLRGHALRIIGRWQIEPLDRTALHGPEDTTFRDSFLSSGITALAAEVPALAAGTPALLDGVHALDVVAAALVVEALALVAGAPAPDAEALALVLGVPALVPAVLRNERGTLPILHGKLGKETGSGGCLGG